MLTKLTALYKSFRKSVCVLFARLTDFSMRRPIAAVAGFLAFQVAVFFVSATWPWMGFVICFASLAITAICLHGIAMGDLNDFVAEPVPASTNA